MTDKEKASAATEASAVSVGADVCSPIVAERLPDVNDCLRLREVISQIEDKDKNIALVVKAAYPGFNRQLLSQCQNPDKYGVLIRPEGLDIIMKAYKVSEPPLDPAPGQTASEDAPKPKRKKEKRRLSRAVTLRMTPKDYQRMEKKVKADGFTSVQGWLYVKVAEYVAGGQYQVKLQRELQTCGMTFLVYGILDCLKAGEIFDIKFKTKSFGSLELAGSYLESPQHSAYFYICPEAYKFTYLVSDGADLYTEEYTPEMTRPIEEIISDFVQFLNDTNNLSTYKEKWLAQ